MDSISKIFTFGEVAKHNSKQDCWIIVNEKVYDVTSYLSEHPGGEDALLSSTGKDATDDFENVGHSKSARKLMAKYFVGDVDPTTLPIGAKINKCKNNEQNCSATTAQGPACCGFAVKLLQFGVPLLVLGLAFTMQYYGKKTKSN